MIFVFEIRNKLDHSLSFGLPKAGPEWKVMMDSGEKRKLRGTLEQVQEWLPYLEDAVKENQIEIVLRWELDAAKAAALKELDSGIFEPLLEVASPARYRRVFISHAATDGPVATRIAEESRTRLPGMETFVTSRAGDIKSGSDWFETVKAELRKADAYVVLLTPNSYERPWVIFETGAAWMAERGFLVVSAGGLPIHDIPEPLKFFQVWSLEGVETTSLAFAELGDSGEGLSEFCEDISKLARGL